MRSIDEISGEVLDVALRLHRDLGPGLLEGVYEALLAGRLSDVGLKVNGRRRLVQSSSRSDSKRHFVPIWWSKGGCWWR